MTALFFIASVVLLLVGHLFRLFRWEQFIRIYERPSHGYLLAGMAGGYALNFFLPFHLGDVFRAVFSGRRMRSGTGFGFSTVIMDRFLDVWFVTVFFVVFRLLGVSGSDADERYYAIFSAVLLGVVLFMLVLRNPLKKVCLAVSGIFNDNIKLDVMTFLWSLINTFKDLLRVNISKLLINTVLMWGAYFASYWSIARCLSLMGFEQSVFDVFSLLFGSKGITQTTISAAAAVSGKIEIVFIAWLFVPVLIMFIVTLLPRKLKNSISSVTGVDRKYDYENLLPQVEPKDRSIFLSRYFGLENQEYLAKFLEINRNISIIQDYSSGSNATTMLCMDTNTTFFRKYAFGADGEKLTHQLEWLKKHEGRLPLCGIIRSSCDEKCCWYDMVYYPDAIDFFRFIHSNPIERSISILTDILDTLNGNLYSGAQTDSPDKLNEYIDTKVLRNLERIRESRSIRELLEYDTLVINGKEYDNLNRIESYLERDFLAGLFSSDPVSDIHGDLTIENIICRIDSETGWYLIDPNTGNVHDSPFLDFAKLLQSLHGNYEFMMMTSRCSVRDNHIDFQLTRSGAYDVLLAELKNYLILKYGKEAWKSICMHEVIHWLRLLPYKLSKDRKRAPMFYAGFVMVANEVIGELEDEK